ncbi:hypothetical protein [Streptomyces fuscigenes]|uniref:hypothetical protein n=1 Tax=Streptomyces fuscigenes TaxID=1528880 RepID=UPI001F2FA334|nr:hypothetical protein [Streptomyces fuscigenes]MCF3964156.1 hypothetical protein [Streptomyces fuscigenes]
MAPGNSSAKLPVVAEAEAALRALGARGAALDQRPAGRGHWFADWSGALAGSDVYLAIMGKEATARKVRLVLDDWILEDVATSHLAEVVTAVFSGRASIRRRRAWFLVPVQTLRVGAGRAHYSAAKKLPPEGTPRAPWEEALLDADPDADSDT